jgi:hypothetical protein
MTTLYCQAALQGNWLHQPSSKPLYFISSFNKKNTTLDEYISEGSHAPITPNFPSGFNREIVGDYVQI